MSEDADYKSLTEAVRIARRDFSPPSIPIQFDGSQPSAPVESISKPVEPWWNEKATGPQPTCEICGALMMRTCHDNIKGRNPGWECWACNNYHEDAAEPKAATQLCDDEGCPHHGTPHVCISSDDRIAYLQDALRTVQAERDIRHTAIQQPLIDGMQKLAKERDQAITRCNWLHGDYEGQITHYRDQLLREQEKQKQEAVEQFNAGKPDAWRYVVIVNKHSTGEPLPGQIKINGAWGDPISVQVSLEEPTDPYLVEKTPLYAKPASEKP